MAAVPATAANAANRVVRRGSPARHPASQAHQGGGHQGHAGEQQHVRGVPARVAEHGMELLLEGAALDMLMRVQDDAGEEEDAAYGRGTS